MAKVIAIMEEAGVFWQAGELGAVDVGGGGTIAKYVAHMDVDTVDSVSYTHLDVYKRQDPDQCQKSPSRLISQYDQAYGRVGSCNEHKDHHVVDLSQ